ncbi:helix-turn-helix domain-containing protein [Polaribacter uvawellassae]|uniref:helix-turn-helix domain-containing protein n=1 Tax=Polaribacter uvawellassae TaxID=3133495 RepID=UPI00321B4E67
MENQSLGKNLKYQRTLKGFTQEQLSDASSVGIRTIQRVEKEEVQPHLQTVKLLAEGLQIDLENLMIVDNPNEEVIQRKWMLLLHASPFLGLIIPFANMLFPLFLWIHKANDNKTYDAHGRAVVNFHCSITVYFIISLLLFFPFPGMNFFLTAAIVLFGLITTFINIMSALSKGTFNYPLSIPFLKSKSV